MPAGAFFNKTRGIRCRVRKSCYAAPIFSSRTLQNTMPTDVKLSNTKRVVFSAILLLLSLIIVESFASVVLLIRMRIENAERFTKSEPTYFSSINILYRLGAKAGLWIDRTTVEYEYKPSVSPGLREGTTTAEYEYKISGSSGSFEQDPDLGYRPSPGKHQVTFARRIRGTAEWESLVVNVTRNADGSRWTGKCQPEATTQVYIFGDSFAEGAGVNDEQTFAFLLQNARKDLCVRLFAVGGYGMTQAYIQFSKLRGQIKRSDVIVLGYADFFDVRTVVAPSRLREARDWHKIKQVTQSEMVLPKASLDNNGKIAITYVQQRCDENYGYCDQTDPPKIEMARTTAALINTIAKTTTASVYLLHYGNEDRENPLFGFLDKSVHIISALKGDFDFFVRDDIAGFDNHPGPYWHYAIASKLLQALRSL
jgi:hypothetical protein